MLSSFFLCNYLSHFNLCNFLNITNQLTSYLRGMSSWGLLIFVKANKNFQNLQTPLIAVPPRSPLEDTQPITPGTQLMTWPTGPAQRAGLTSCCSPTFFPGKLPPHLWVSHYTHSPPLGSHLLGQHQQCPLLGILTQGQRKDNLKVEQI